MAQRVKGAAERKIGHEAYKQALYDLQVELVKLQKHIIKRGDRIAVVFEGRDAAGKDGTIKRINAHLSPREVRVVALPKPSDRETRSWYFQRYAPHLPAAEEMVLFNRSWYNRAGVEHVMGFCSDQEYEGFFDDVTVFEEMLVRSGIRLLKYYLDITRAEQKRRLRARKKDPLTQWKMSPIDAAAQKLWPKYSQARDTMLARTHAPLAPWHIVRADDKRRARLNVMRDMLSRLDYVDKRAEIIVPDPAIVFPYSEEARRAELIAP